MWLNDMLVINICEIDFEIRSYLLSNDFQLVILLGAVGLLFISTGVTMAVPYAVGAFIDIIHTSNADPAAVKATLLPLCKVLGGVFIIGAMANFGRVYLIQTSGMSRLFDGFVTNIDLVLCVENQKQT